MSIETKISSAFEPFLSETGPNDKRDAIVIFKVPAMESFRVKGHLRSLKKRLDFVKAKANAQRPVQEKLFDYYQKEGTRQLPKKQRLNVSSIGANSLPMASFEVTRKTLITLAKQPNVAAILPNQKIHLIKPTSINYSKLFRQEAKDKLTWGLKQLEILKVWKTTKGKDINVAVMDTGVHGDHPALKDKIKEFVLIDPLGRRVTAKPSFDSGQHGTHVCVTIAGGKTPEGISIGVAPEVNLLVAGALVGDANLRTLLEGICWAI